jgi:hypothetical protein
MYYNILKIKKKSEKDYFNAFSSKKYFKKISCTTIPNTY